MPNHPCKAYPRKRVFSSDDLRRFFKVDKNQFDYGVSRDIISTSDTRREDITDEMVSVWDSLSKVVFLRTSDIAATARVSPATVLKHARRENIEPSVIQTLHTYGRASKMFLWSPEDAEDLVRICAKSADVKKDASNGVAQRVAERGDADRERRNSLRDARMAAASVGEDRAKLIKDMKKSFRFRADIVDKRMSVSVHHRGQNSGRTVDMHLGATNSGKTYHGIKALVDAYLEDVAFSDNGVAPCSYVYAGPLRLLAHEVRDAIASHVGEDVVGVLTGEERVNPSAPIVCCTAEMAPREGKFLIVDEAHWAADDSRGRHWTELLLSSEFDSIVILGPSGCESLFRQAVNGSSVTVTNHERKVPLVYVGDTHGNIKPKTAVVAFSRRKVTEIVECLQRRGITALPLYGALPLSVRKAHVSSFLNGEVDVVVTTDVIGHGINLPIDNVVFVDTEKFDGHTRRQLTDMEGAQIAGRAGRFGFCDEGTVGYWSFCGGGRFGNSEINDGFIRRAVSIASGELRSSVEDSARLNIVPSLRSLKLEDNDHALLGYAMRRWVFAARSKFKGSDLVTVSNLIEARSNLSAVASRMNAPLYELDGSVTLLRGVPVTEWDMSISDLWSLIHGPFNPETIALHAGASWFRTHNTVELRSKYMTALHMRAYTHRESLEARAREISAFRSLGVMLDPYGGGDLPCGITAERMKSDEENVAAKLVAEFARDLDIVKTRMERSQSKRNRRSHAVAV